MGVVQRWLEDACVRLAQPGDSRALGFYQPSDCVTCFVSPRMKSVITIISNCRKVNPGTKYCKRDPGGCLWGTPGVKQKRLMSRLNEEAIPLNAEAKLKHSLQALTLSQTFQMSQNYSHYKAIKTKNTRPSLQSTNENLFSTPSKGQRTKGQRPMISSFYFTRLPRWR